MAKYHTIQELFDEKLNPQEIYHSVIQEGTKKKNRVFCFRIATASFMSIIFIFLSSIFVYHTFSLPKNTNDSIFINEFNPKKIKHYDIELEGAIISINPTQNQKIREEFAFLEDLELPSNPNHFLDTNDTLILEKPTSHITGYLYYKEDIFHTTSYQDYIPVLYWYQYTLEQDKKMILGFSKTIKEVLAIPEEFLYLDSNFSLQDSWIRGYPVMIQKIEKEYRVLFQYQELYFGIHTTNMTQEEVIRIIKSIIKEEK